jgi:outer membrane receptor protein involved in Fe transport
VEASPRGWANVARVINNDIAGPTYLNIFQMIQGRVAGVQVSGSGSNYRLRIRGATGPPLVVIDGIPFMGYSDAYLNHLLLSISPADVDYIEIRKRITSSFIYGAGSRRGVIVVRTRLAQ